jgi:hypothetical protein
MEKTGSSFISALLRKYSAEREIRRKHHAPMTRKCDRSKFHFISVRDPLDCYLSLYSFGCMFRGKLHGHLEAEDLSSKFYNGTEDGFNAWLKYVLKPSNAEKLGDGYGGYNGAIAKLMGFQSYRYLRLALPGGMGPLSKCKDRKGVRALRALKITPGVLHLNEGHSAFAGLEMIRDRRHVGSSGAVRLGNEIADLLAIVGRTFVPLMLQNERAYEDAVRRGERVFNERAFDARCALYDGTLLGKPFRSVVKTFQVRVWRDLREAWRRLEPEARAQLAPLITDETIDGSPNVLRPLETAARTSGRSALGGSA